MEYIYATVDVAVVQLNIYLDMDPRHLRGQAPRSALGPGSESVKTAFAERIQIASFSLMGN